MSNERIVVPAGANQMYRHYFDYRKITAEEIDMLTIAHSLALICRFNGQINRFFSVGAHVCFVHDRMWEDGRTKRQCLLGLLHDCHEGIFQDMTRPLKDFVIAEFNFDPNIITDKIDAAIYAKLGIEPPDEHEKNLIKHYDNRSLFTEKEYLFSEKMDWGWFVQPYHHSTFEYYLDYGKSWENEFLNRLETYQNEGICHYG